MARFLAQNRVSPPIPSTPGKLGYPPLHSLVGLVHPPSRYYQYRLYYLATSYYPASTPSRGSGSTGSLQTNQSAQYYGSQYSAPSGTSGYGERHSLCGAMLSADGGLMEVTAPSTYYTTAGSSASLHQSGSTSSSGQWSTDANQGRR